MSSVQVTIQVPTNNNSHEFFFKKMKRVMEEGRKTKITWFDDTGVGWESVEASVVQVEK